MSYYSGGQPRLIKPTASHRAIFPFLVPPNTACTEAWVLAQAGINATGPLTVQLVDPYGRALCDVTEIYSSEPTLSKFTNVKIDKSPQPAIVNVSVVNKSTADHSDAQVCGVMLVY